MATFTWGAAPNTLTFDIGADRPVVASLDPTTRHNEPPKARHRAAQALVEVLSVGHGRGLTDIRLSRTALGDQLRYREHRTGSEGGQSWVEIVQSDETSGLVAVTRFEHPAATPAYRVTTRLQNSGNQKIMLQAVSSFGLDGLTQFIGQAPQVWTARSEWCAESRWYPTELNSGAGLPPMNPDIHGHAGRGCLSRTGHSTWSSGGWLPMGALLDPATGHTVLWQLEGGPWHWELNSQYADDNAVGLLCFGPTDLQHGWLQELPPGGEFTTPAATFALAEDGIAGAAANLNTYRRQFRYSGTADAQHPLIYNDYMNALMGDPTTEKLLPLIKTAASVGAKYFCIDAGWYDDDGHWWPSVGAWEPSERRFAPDGLVAVLDEIRANGMQPGLWVEPEVVGVQSATAQQLPEDAFMHRGGQRIVEHDRYFLDLRSSAARNHLDSVFQRLIEDYGSRYFKWDYNVTPGPGPDTDSASPGAGLLAHSRAMLTWFEGLRARYPDVIFEACSSGAQRMDASIVSRFDLQSTSDQQDYRLYPAIAAAAPMSLPFEQAGNWAYPQSEMTDEQIAFNLVTGLSGRLYLSGNIDRLSKDQLALVSEATELYSSLIEHQAKASPRWPLGLPQWDDDVIVLASETAISSQIFVWVRRPQAAPITIPLPHLAGSTRLARTGFPTGLGAWEINWDDAAGSLTLNPGSRDESARVITIEAAN